MRHCLLLQHKAPSKSIVEKTTVKNQTGIIFCRSMSLSSIMEASVKVKVASGNINLGLLSIIKEGARMHVKRTGTI